MGRSSRLAGLAIIAALVSMFAVMFGAVIGEPASGQDRARERSRDEASAPDSEEPDAPEGVDDVDVDSTLREEGGSKVKVMDFGDFDISGRLKSPQLLYFLNRLRAEFDRPRLPHRSFVGEMERSTHEKSF